MSTEPEKRQVRIVSRTTGEVRLSEPMPVQSPNQQAGNASPADTVLVETAVPVEAAPVLLPIAEPPAAPAAMPEVATASELNKPAKAPKPSKPKLVIESFEQFIEHAYSNRRGQPVKLERRLQDTLAKQPELDEAAKGRLLRLINGDTMLRVPRQLLLASKEITGLPKLRGALVEVVKTAMLHHPAFEPAGVKAAMQNLPGSQPAEAMVAVAGYEPAAVESKEPLKPTELKELRRNAVQLLAVWFALHRGLGLDDLANLLFHVLWEPAQRELDDDTERLRALTDIEDLAGTGVAAQRFRQQLADARRDRESALRETAALKQQVAGLQSQRDLAHAQVEERTAELEALRVSSAQELAALRDAHNTGRMQQGHEFESLRGRLIQRLEECIEMLDTGLNALRKEAPTPRVSVMTQRAEVVLDALRSELINLKKG